MTETMGSAADAAEQLFFDRWYALTPEEGTRVIAAAQALPNEALLQRPMLVTGALVALQLHATDAGSSQAAGLERFANVVGRSPDPALLRALPATRQRQWMIMEMIARRWRRDYAGAMELADDLRVEPTHADLKSALFSGRSDELWPGHLNVQRGVTEALGGSLSASLRTFTRAYHEGGEPPSWHFAKTNAAANVAMLSAIEGLDEAAAAWIELAQQAGPIPTPIHHLTFLGSDIAAALLAIDLGRLDEAHRVLDPLAPAGEAFELWPFLLYASTSLDLAEGNAVRAHERLKAAGYARDRVTAVDTVADHLVFRAYLDALIDAGEGGIALRLANDLGHPLRSLAPVARTHLYAGDYVSASRVASHALRRAQLSRRDMWKATTIHALAELAQGNVETALQSFTRITEGKPYLLPGILRRMPQPLVAALYEAAREDLPDFTAVQRRLEITVPRLTSRESEILQRLAENVSPRAIAEQERTSEHTVRTHVKNIYRKLDVSNRKDAIARAEHLGLLRWAHLDGENRVL